MSVVARSVGRAGLATYRALRRARTKAFSLLVSGAFARFGAHSVLEPPVRLSGEHFIEIGSNVFIGPGSWLQVLGTEHETSAIVIGDETSIVGACVLSAATSLRLGRGVLFARNVYVSDHMHEYEETGHPVQEQGITRVAPVTIADGAWLGQNVVVGPGVRIGRGAVIGANSVVLHDVPDFSVAVGAPARVVRHFAHQPTGND